MRRVGLTLSVLAAIVNCSTSKDATPAPATSPGPAEAGVLAEAAAADGGIPGSAAPDASPIVPPTFDASKLAYHVNTLTPIEENRVYQRNAQGQLRITVTIDAQPRTKKLFYHLTDDKGVSQPWQQELDGAGPTYTITLPQGGPYKIEMFQVDADNFTIAQNSSPVFGVGDVFITAGQSNSANHGDVETTPTEPFVMALDPTAKTWAVAADPQPLASKWSDPDFGSSTRPSGSPWPSFADAMRKFTGVPIGLVSLGYGGSAASGWQPGATWTNGAFSFDLFGRITTAASLLGECRFKAVLWHQGESDVGTAEATYAGELRTMITSAQQMTGCSQPWMIAKASFQKGLAAGAGDTARAAQQQVIDEGTALAGPDTDTLVDAFRSAVDGTHFSGPGLVKHGQLWATAVQTALY